MQFGFMPGKSTSDAIFIVRQLQEKHLAKSKSLYFAFVDLEKAFDRVPREVVRWALRRAGVVEYLVTAIMAMYEEPRTMMRTCVGDSESFPVKVGVHQGSVLSSLMFSIVLDRASQDCRSGLPWELLYADDLVLLDTSKESLVTRVKAWKEDLSSKGMEINALKSKIMHSSNTCRPSGTRLSGEWPCGVCGCGVGANSIKCTTCNMWIHKRCSGIRGSLSRATSDFVCKSCSGHLAQPRVQDMEDLMIEGERFENVQSFCYLGDTLSADGGADLAVSTRIRCGWKKFHDLAPFLTSRAPSLRVKSQVSVAC